jgi:hypothetical protein
LADTVNGFVRVFVDGPVIRVRVGAEDANLEAACDDLAPEDRVARGKNGSGN